MRVACIVAAAGKGKRLKKKTDKVFVRLTNKPILAYTLKSLEKCSFINDIIVVVSRSKLRSCKRLVKTFKFRKVRSVVKGGRKRFDSVKNGLAKARFADFILVHDGARPFVDQDLARKVFSAAKKYGAALLATPARQTIKTVNRNLFVTKTPDRKFLVEVQTPQAFKGSLILKAYERIKMSYATDDSSLVEKMGHKVKVVPGSYRNIKITTPEDLKLAKAIIG